MPLTRRLSPLSLALLLPLWAGVQARPAVPTPDAATGADALPLESIAAVRTDRDQDTVPDRKGERVHVRGVVTIPTGVLRVDGVQVTIQDQDSGVGLYDRDLPLELAAGDLVDVVGEITQYKGAIQLRDLAVDRIGHQPVPAAEPVPVAEADSRLHLGRRVRVEGVAGALALDDFGMLRLTGDDGGVLSLFIPADVTDRFDWSLYPRGTRVAATGVLSVYKPTWPYDGGFQLIVASPADLVALEPPQPAWQAWAPWAGGAAGLALVLALLALHLLQRRQRARERELKTLAALSTAFASPGLSEAQLARHACELLTAYGIVEAALVHGVDEHGGLCPLAASVTDPKLAVALAAAEAPYPRETESDAHARQVAARLAPLGLRPLAVHPLQAPSGPLGHFVALSARRRHPSGMQERTLLSAVKLLAMALENLRIQQRARIEQQELQQLAITDDLTGLYNRRFLDEYLRVQIPLARRRGGGLAFLAIDIDHFKRINDGHGHPAGDRVLVALAGLLRQASRSCDLPVRLGGEEFVFVVVDQDLDGTLAFAERLRAAIADQAFDVAEGEPLRVTASIGVALFGLHGRDATALLRAADEAMYVSKRHGRNRVTLAELVEGDTGEAEPSRGA